MKKLILGIFVIFCITLSARENPFVKYEEDAGAMLEVNETPKTIEEIQEAEYIKKVQQQIKEQEEKAAIASKPIPAKPVEKTYSKKELDAIIQKTKKQTEQKTKEIVKKEIANVKKEPEQVVYVKPRADVTEETTTVTATTTTEGGSTNSSAIKAILPFLSMQSSDDELVIKSEHKMFKKFSIDKENKLVFDYRAKVNFYTKREALNTKNFKNLVVGNHQKGGYFRVAVELINKPSSYSVDVKEDSIIIRMK